MAIIKQVSRVCNLIVVGSLARPPFQVQTIEADSKCQELWELLQWTRREESMTIHDVIAYRREAEQHVGSDENLYRFEWVCLIPVGTGAG